MKKPTEGKSKSLIASLILLLAVPVVYVLSIGPAVWLQANGYLSPWAENALEVIYLPIAWMVNNSELAAGIFMAYIRWFVDLG